MLKYPVHVATLFGGDFIPAIRVDKVHKKKSLVEIGLGVIGSALALHLGPVGYLAGGAIANVIGNILPDITETFGIELLDRKYEALIEKLQKSGLKEVDVLVLKAYEETIEDLKKEYKKPKFPRLGGSSGEKEKIRNWLDCIDRKLEEMIREGEKSGGKFGVNRLHKVNQEEAIDEVVTFLEGLGCGEPSEELEKFIKEEFVPKFLDNITKKSVAHPALMALLLKEILEEISEEDEQVKEIVNVLGDYLKLEKGGIEKRQEEYLEKLLEKPFTGREEEIKKILSLINNKRSGKIVVTGPAGVGKSSLLAHVIEEILKLEDVNVSFYFFSATESMRDPTEAIRHILFSVGLSSIGKGKNRDTSNLMLSTDRPERLSNVLLGLLREGTFNKKTVIVIDGLDEADSVEFEKIPCPFPETLPDNVYLILGVRGSRENPEIPGTSIVREEWVRNAEFIELTDLTEENIRELVSDSLGVEEEKAREIAGEIYRKTGGYALYVSYLLEELRDKAGNNPDLDRILERVKRLPMSFEDYVEEELEKMERNEDGDVVDYLFALLSVAKEPLSVAEISKILNIRKRKIKRLGHVVKRWLSISKEEGEEKWTLQHEKLKVVFGKLLDEEVDEVREKLINYCSNWEGREYCIKHYPEHLFEAGRYEELIELAKDNSFRDTQRSVSANLVFRTLELAMDAAANVGNIGEIIELAFLLNKEHNRKFSILNYYEEHELEDTLELIKRNPSENLRLMWLLLLSTYAGQLGRNGAIHVLERGKSIVRTYGQVIESLKDLWTTLPEREVINVTVTLEQILDDVIRFSNRTSRDITTEFLVQIVEVFVQAGKIEKALKIAEKIEDPGNLSKALVGIAEAFIQAGETSRALEILHKVLKIIGKIENPWKRSEVLVKIAGAFAHMGMLGKALEIVGKIENSRERSKALIEIANALIQTGNTEKALEIIGKIENVEDWSGMLVEIAEVFSQAGKTRKAIKLIESVLKTTEERFEHNYLYLNYNYYRTLVEIARAFDQVGETEKALKLLETALEVFYELVDCLEVYGSHCGPGSGARVLIEIARAFAQLGETKKELETLGKALEIAKRIEDSKALIEISGAFAQLGETRKSIEILEEALKIVEWAYNPDGYVQALLKIGRAFTQVGENEKALKILEEALEASNRILYVPYYGYNVDYYRTLTKIAKTLVQIGEAKKAVKLLENTLKTAEKTYDPYNTNDLFFLDYFEVSVDIALVFAQLGETEKARTLLEIAGRVYYQSSDWVLVLVKIAEGFSQLGETKKALETLKKALEIAEELGNLQKRSKVLIRIAEAFIQVGKSEESLKILEKALKIVKKIKSPEAHAEILKDIAGAFVQVGETKKALEISEKTLETTKKIEDPRKRSEVLVGISEVLIQAKKTKEALKMLDEALRVVGEIKEPWERSESLIKIIIVFIKVGEIKKAVKLIEDTLKTAEEINDSHKYFEVLKKIARTLGKIGMNEPYVVKETFRRASILSTTGFYTIIGEYLEFSIEENKNLVTKIVEEI